VYVGQGVGDTADFNNFVYASENSDAHATITKVHGQHEISTGFVAAWFNDHCFSMTCTRPTRAVRPAQAALFLSDESFLSCLK
jgi:hypothetical protein